MDDPRSDRGTTPVRIGLVGCVKGKAATAQPARDLYTSALFLGRRRYVERTCSRWYIISARHGLIHPDRILEPYDESLTSKPRPARRTWSARVLGQLDELAIDYPASIFDIHAGAAYWDFGLAEGLEQRGARVTIPTRGMAQGHQLAFYSVPPATSFPRHRSDPRP